jgi:hypothetical protein
LSFSNPGHAISAVGLGVAGLAALAGAFLTFVGTARTVEQAIRGGAVATAFATLLVAGAAASVVYIAATGTTVGGSHGHESTVAGAAADGGEHTGHHDHGPHPTFAAFRTQPAGELAASSPASTVDARDVPALKAELETVYARAAALDTVEKARAAGFDPASADAQGMGAHYINLDYLSDGIFDPARPEGLLFSRVDDGAPKLVGVWFLQLPGSGGSTEEVAPAGFATDLDLWHGHDGICYVGLQGVSENVTEAACQERGGMYIGDQRWMLHVWVADESDNPDGVFAYLNADLASRQVEALPIGQGEFILGLTTP